MLEEVYAEPTDLNEACRQVTDAVRYCIRNSYAFSAASLALNLVDALGSLIVTGSEPPGKRFEAFMRQYFPSAYAVGDVAGRLWDDLRCPLSHAGSVGRGIIVSCTTGEEHLHLQTVEDQTGEPCWFVHVGQLATDLSQAVGQYLGDLRINQTLKARADTRLRGRL